MKLLFTSFSQKNQTSFPVSPRLIINQEKITERIFVDDVYQITVQEASALGQEQSVLFYCPDYFPNPETYASNDSLIFTRYRKIGGTQILETLDVYGNFLYAYEQQFNGKLIVVCTNDLNTGVNEFEVEELYDDIYSLITSIPAPAALLISTTRADLLSKISADRIIPGTRYHITDAQATNIPYAYSTEVWVVGLTSNTVSIEGEREHFYPRTESYIIGTDPDSNYWIGVWHQTKTVVAGQKCVWGGKCWVNTTSNIGTFITSSDLDTTDWDLIDPSSFTNGEYVKTIFSVNYNIFTDWICKQNDVRNNEIGSPEMDVDFNPCDITIWNHPFFKDNKCVGGVINDATNSIYLNKTSSSIYRNFCETIVSNNCNSISDNSCYIIRGNIRSSISSNSCYEISENTSNLISSNLCFSIVSNESYVIAGNEIDSEISFNTCEYISNNTSTGGGIVNNFCTDISNNNCTGYIQGNHGKLITGNTAIDITRNYMSEILSNGSMIRASISNNVGYYIEACQDVITNNRSQSVYNNQNSVIGNTAVQIKNNLSLIQNNQCIDIVANTGIVSNNIVSQISNNDCAEISGCKGTSFTGNGTSTFYIRDCSFLKIDDCTIGSNINNNNFLTSLNSNTFSGTAGMISTNSSITKFDSVLFNVEEELISGTITYNPF
jgi:hypothetical protein